MDLVFFGIQGCGKGTQAKLVAKEFDYDIFEAGGELRAIAASGSQLGETVKSYIDQGHLVPHDIIMKVVQEAIEKRPQHQKILFDGIPRDQEQMQDFNRIMTVTNRNFRCIHFLLDAEEAMKRILGRAEAEGRKDDANTEIIKRRMLTFETKTLPVIGKYKEAGKVTEISAKKGVDEIFEGLKKDIQEKE